MNADWTKNPGLSGIDPAKLAMLQSLASQGSGKKQNELLPFSWLPRLQQNRKGSSSQRKKWI